MRYNQIPTYYARCLTLNAMRFPRTHQTPSQKNKKQLIIASYRLIKVWVIFCTEEYISQHTCAWCTLTVMPCHAILDTLQWYCPRFLESMSKILANIAMDFSRFLRSRTLSPGTFTDQNIGSGSLGTHPDTEKKHGVQHLFFGVASNVSAITKDLGLTISEAEGSTCVIPKHLRLLVLDTGQKGFFPHLLFH